jgi:hypothetical protein
MPELPTNNIANIVHDGRNDMVGAEKVFTTYKTMPYCSNLTEVPMSEAYCVKCKAKKVIKGAQQVTLKNGKPATTGACPDCGTKIFRIGSSK